MSARLIPALLLAALLLPQPHPAFAAEGGADELAGEKESAARPAAKPTLAEPEQGGPVSLSRPAQAQAPSFELPEFVITGSGERKAVSRRPELSNWLDTSGGIKASPSEAEASKGQVGPGAGRQTLSPLTESARPAYGQARLLYGTSNTLEGGAFYGMEMGQLFWLLEGSHASSDGGPSPIPAVTINQSREDQLSGHGGWRRDGGGQLGLGLSGAWRDRLLTRIPLPAPRMQRSLEQADLNWEGAPQSPWRERLSLEASKAAVLLPGLGTAYEEGRLGLRASAEKELLTRFSRTLLMADLRLAQLDQNLGDRQVILAGGGLLVRMDAWKGARVSLGLGLDSASGGTEALMVAPRAELEQRLGRGWGLWLRFAPGLELPTLQGGLFDKDPLLPSPRSKASKDSLNLEGGLSAALGGDCALEIKAGLRQNEDAVAWDDPAGLGVWSTVNLRGMRRAYAELGESAPLWGEFSERLSLRLNSTELLDSPGLVATFAPAWEARLNLGWKRDPWSVDLGLRAQGEREGRLSGGDRMPAYLDLGARAGYEVNEWLGFFAEGRNLLSSAVQEFSGYAEPAPMAGIGAEAKF